MYAVPGARGQGLGRRVLVELEEHARRLGYRGIVLETGVQQVEAPRLYRSAGYAPIPCYGAYAGPPISRCFEKPL
jgi:putative acetyltransferase